MLQSENKLTGDANVEMGGDHVRTAAEIREELSVRLVKRLEARYNNSTLAFYVKLLETTPDAKLQEMVQTYWDPTTQKGYTVSELVAMNRAGFKFQTNLVSMNIAKLEKRTVEPEQFKLTTGTKKGLLPSSLSQMHIDSRTSHSYNYFNTTTSTEYYGVHLESACPFLVLDQVLDKPIEWWPHFFTQGYSVHMMKAINLAYSYVVYGASTENERALWQQKYADIVSVVSNSYRGNGTFMGMLGRYKACYDVAMKIRPNAIIKQKLGMPAVSELFKLWPVVNPIVEFRDDNYLQQLMDLDEKGYPVLHVNPGASMGFLYDDAKKKDSIYPLIVDGERFVKFVYKYGIERAKVAAYPMFISEAKPKDELYLRDQAFTKTRIIYALNGSANVPCQMVYGSIFRDLKAHCYPYAEGSKTILGMPATNGHYMNLIDTMLERSKKKVEMVFMSDNIFLVGSFMVDVEGTKIRQRMWLSLDGEKMESCITRYDIQEFNEYIIMKFKEADIPLPPQLEYYIREAQPLLACDFEGLLGDKLLKVLGQSSGNAGTAFYNNYRMMKVVSALQTFNFKDSVFLVLDKPTGEYKVAPTAASLIHGAGVSLKVEATAMVSDYEREYFRADLLGFDFARLEIGSFSKMIPVLSKDRLIGSTLFPSKNSTGLSELVYELTRLRVMYLFGAWANPVLAAGIKQRFTQLFQAMRKDNATPVVIAEVLAIIEHEIEPQFTTQELQQYFSIFSRNVLPSLYDVVALFCNEVDRHEFVLAAIEVVKKADPSMHADLLSGYFPDIVPYYNDQTVLLNAFPVLADKIGISLLVQTEGPLQAIAAHPLLAEKYMFKEDDREAPIQKDFQDLEYTTPKDVYSVTQPLTDTVAQDRVAAESAISYLMDIFGDFKWLNDHLEAYMEKFDAKAARTLFFLYLSRTRRVKLAALIAAYNKALQSGLIIPLVIRPARTDTPPLSSFPSLEDWKRSGRSAFIGAKKVRNNELDFENLIAKPSWGQDQIYEDSTTFIPRAKLTDTDAFTRQVKTLDTQAKIVERSNKLSEKVNRPVIETKKQNVPVTKQPISKPPPQRKTKSELLAIIEAQKKEKAKLQQDLEQHLIVNSVAELVKNLRDPRLLFTNSVNKIVEGKTPADRIKLYQEIQRATGKDMYFTAKPLLPVGTKQSEWMNPIPAKPIQPRGRRTVDLVEQIENETGFVEFKKQKVPVQKPTVVSQPIQAPPPAPTPTNIGARKRRVVALDDVLDNSYKPPSSST